jgi:PAS domain S-box-containing protein
MPPAIPFEDIVHAVHNGLIVTDLQARIVFINRPALELLQFAESEILGQPIVQRLPITGPLVVECLATGEPQLGCHILGKNVDLVVNVTVIEKEGRRLGAVCSFQGMREFELAAQKLQSYNNLNRELTAIFNSSSDGIWVCDGQGIVTNLNSASEKLNGVEAKDVIGRNVRHIVDSGAIDRSVTLEVLETRRQVTIVQHVKKTQKYLLVTGTPTFDEKGDIFLVVVNERDMTQLNAMRRELEQTRQVTRKYKDELANLSMMELSKQPLISESRPMRLVVETALKLAHTEDANVLILGESGTGKGMLAKLIHKHGSPEIKPFVRINCAAVPENLLEAELFGYEKGAFTGAREQGKVGLIELAHGGTLFLDEIGDLPITVQAKLLTYLDDHEIMPLGGLRPRQVACRIIAATNLDLEALVKAKHFRQDLFYRLNGFTLRVPPLRERPEDLFEFINYYLSKYNRAYGRCGRLGREGLEALSAHPFPGNVRELKNLIKKAVVMSDSDRLDDFILKSIPETGRYPDLAERESGAAADRFTLALSKLEKQLLEEALTCCRSTRQMAAYLGISQPTVVRKLKRHGLSGI